MEFLAANKTLILVTHDLRISKNFDQILVMHEGAIAGFATHKELIENNVIYKDLWKLDQFSEETN